MNAETMQLADSLEEAETDPAILFERALGHHQAGRLADAQRIYRRIVGLDPRHADALHLLGVAATQTGRHEDALGLIRQAIGLNPKSASYHLNLGAVLQTLGRLAEAVASFEAALDRKRDAPEAHNNLGNALRLQGRLGEALPCFVAALALRPDFPAAANNLAVVLKELRRFDDSAAVCRRFIAFRPGDVASYNNLAIALTRLGRAGEAVGVLHRALRIEAARWDLLNSLGNAYQAMDRPREALACFSQAIRLRPDNWVSHSNLGCAARDLGRSAVAAGCFRRALVLKPDVAEALNNLGLALRDQGGLEEAVVCHARALRLDPDFPDAHNNLGIAWQERGLVLPARECFSRVLAVSPASAEALNNLGLAFQESGGSGELWYRRAIQVAPGFAEAHQNLAMSLLASGDWEAGWREYEWRWKTRDGPRRHPLARGPLWQGEAGVGRTLLIYAEQGFGDSLQFCRYVPWAAERGWSICLEVPAPLVRLFASLSGVARIVASGEALPRFDAHLPMLSLPRVLGATLAGIPAGVPYLRADPAKTSFWRQRLDGDPRLCVGLAWAGRRRADLPRASAIDRRRSMTPDLLAPLFDLSDVRFVSLQKDGPALGANAPVLDVMGEIGDFADTAALVANLDLVISVDTSVVHLAGALGKPVWMLDRFDPCWRWLRGRNDSPWYPGLRIFRQTSPGDWAGVIERVAACLAGYRHQGG